jgi:hypothetical protein
MNTVYKYELEIGATRIALPIGAKILHVDMQNETPQLWALHRKGETETQWRKIVMFGTGHQISEKAHELAHISTIKDGLYVWHFFEVLS